MEDFNTLQPAVQSALVSTTRSAASLSNEDLPFHRSLSSSLATRLDRQNARLLALASNLLGAAASPSDSVRAAPSLKNLDSIDGNWRGVIDVVDSLLERADTALDEYTGAVRRMTPDLEVQSHTPKKGSKVMHELHARQIEKPQLTFENVPTNRETGPFKPLLLSKPHAVKPPAIEPIVIDGKKQYPHPYQLEIEQYRYPSSVYTRSDPIPYSPFESTSATLVDTEEGVFEMLDELKKAKEIAIDLEHHDQRSYIGIVSLMQISTRDHDWIVDTLKPWRRKLQCLNEVLADPSIIKVLHGAYMDIVWLQRDLGLYIVGLFDTHYAARALHYQGGSLAFLLKKFANVDANKQFQLADWRQRPLPAALLDYARSDTHYLLYIFDCMRNELVERSDFARPDGEGDLVTTVLKKSSETALQRYENPIYDAELGQGSGGWYKLISRTPALLNKEQFAVFKAVHQWRDEIARAEDDSVHYVMPNHQVFSVAREMPTNRAALLGLAQPTTQAVKLRADELVAVVLKGKEDGKDGPTMLEVLEKIEPTYPKGPAAKETAAHSVAPFVPKEVLAPKETPTSLLPLRSAMSSFWGRAMGVTNENQRRPFSTVPDLSTMLMPPTAEVLELDGVDSPLQTRRPEPETTSSSPAPNEDLDSSEQILVLREHGRKRKRTAHDHQPPPTDALATQSNKVSLGDDENDDDRLRAKAERRKARKEAKKAASNNLATPITNGDVQIEAPYDYASAPGMLKPPREERGRGSNGPERERKKQVNPYAKVLDAPKGAPRNPAAKEKAGRSMTYR